MSRLCFRDQRVFYVDDPGGEAGGWYFDVRKALPHGPYATQSLAEQALADFLDGHEASSRLRGEVGADGPDDER